MSVQCLLKARKDGEVRFLHFVDFLKFLNGHPDEVI